MLPHRVIMNRVFYGLANLCAGAVLLLIILDPTRSLLPIFGLLALAVVLTFLPRYFRR